MQATVVISSNPFHPHLGRSLRTVRARRCVAALAPKTRQPFICLLNGAPLLRAQWPQTRLSDGDVLAFVTLPQGGGGGGGGSDPLRTVAMLAVVYYTGGLGGAMLGIEGAAAVGGFGVAVANAAVTMAGIALVNAILPPPSLPSPRAQADLAAPSPTYSLSAQGNSARIGSAIPVQYGRHIAYPDFAAQPWAEFAGNEQYLYQLFCIGQGHHDIEALRLEDTPLSSFEDVAYEVVRPGQSVTLFPTNVVTATEVAGAEAQTGVYLGPFVASASGVQVNQIALDMVCPRGLYYANDDGSLGPKTVTYKVEIQPIDAGGAATGPWVVYDQNTMGNVIAATLADVSAGFQNVTFMGMPMPSPVITGGTNTPQRVSIRIPVALGRYQVRLMRTDTKDTSTRAGHDLNWAGLRAFIPGGQNYGNVTLVAVRMKASNNLSQAASRKFNVICTRKLPVWNGTSWSAPVATRSIAWAIADACRNADYGAGLTDAQINLPQLLALDAVWAARGDTFDGRFDNSQVFWEAVTQIARAGRAKPFQQSGVMQVVRDQAQSLPVAMFSPRNTVRGSLKIDYLMPTPETADAVTVSYFDAATWQPAEVTASLPGSVAAKPARVELFGVTSRAQAWREGMYMAACNRYRRKPISLTTEMEGFIPSYGDLVAVASERLTAAQSGDVVAWDAGTLTITTSEPLTWKTGQAHYMALRRRDGSMSGPYAATAGTNAYKAVLASAPDFTPYTGGNEERTHFSFGTATEYRQLALLMAARPRGHLVELALINEYIDGSGQQYVHLADAGTPPAALAGWQLPRLFPEPSIPSNPTVSETLVAIEGIVHTRMDVSWGFDPVAEGYRVAWRRGTGNWNTVPDTTLTHVSVLDVPEGTLEVRVAAFCGAREGTPAYVTKELYGKIAPPAAVTGFTVTKSTGFALAEWALHPDLDVRLGGRIVVRHSPLTSGAAWEDGVIVQEFNGDAVSGTLPLMTGTYLAKARDSSGNWSTTAASFVVTEGMVTGFTTVASSVQHPAFAGAKSNTAVLDSALRLGSLSTISTMAGTVSTWGKISSLGGIRSTGSYAFDAVLDHGAVATRRLEADIQALSFNTGDTISRRGLVSQWGSVVGAAVNDCDATLYVSTTNDDPAGTPTWGPWAPFFVGDFTCRAERFRLDLASGQPTNNIRINALRVDAKVPA